MCLPAATLRLQRRTATAQRSEIQLVPDRGPGANLIFDLFLTNSPNLAPFAVGPDTGNLNSSQVQEQGRYNDSGYFNTGVKDSGRHGSWSCYWWMMPLNCWSVAAGGKRPHVRRNKVFRLAVKSLTSDAQNGLRKPLRLWCRQWMSNANGGGAGDTAAAIELHLLTPGSRAARREAYEQLVSQAFPSSSGRVPRRGRRGPPRRRGT